MKEDELYQAITFLVFILFFNFLELRHPGFPVSRKRDLPLNVLAMLLVIVAGEMWKKVIAQGFNAVHLGLLLSQASSSWLPSGLKILLAIILADFCLYWVHRTMHGSLLWRTHSFHHSIAEIWWLAGSRTSMTHLLLFAVPQVVIGRYLLALSLWEEGLAYSFAVMVNLWIHTNLWLPPSPLEWLIITPNYHRAHHGGRELNYKNLGFVFTVWDRMFERSFPSPRSPRTSVFSAWLLVFRTTGIGYLRDGAEGGLET
jgi:sterol desaturase/sphingolipid hydroxylase (fatty acid hydroxylase superfamily)